MFKLQLIPLILLLLFCVQRPGSAREPTPKQVAEWEKLYPKMNSKMARMEELLNHIDRFLDSPDFKAQLVQNALEFRFLATQAMKHVPPSLPEKDQRRYAAALKRVAECGKSLQQAIEDNRPAEARKLFKELDVIRRKSHTEWG